jgi:cobalt/nickel transport system permease protein
MHLSEGVLPLPMLLVTGALAAGAVAVGLRRLDEARMPAAALLGAAFFVAGTLHVPVGVGSVHLVLNGLMGLLLGWTVFPVLAVALALQALLFGFGGLTVLGANVLVLGVPALLAHLLLRRHLAVGASPRRLRAAGALAGVLGIGGAALGMTALLATAGGAAFDRLVALVWVAHVPVGAIDAAIGALAVPLLARMMPRALAMVARSPEAAAALPAGAAAVMVPSVVAASAAPAPPSHGAGTDAAVPRCAMPIATAGWPTEPRA